MHAWSHLSQTCAPISCRECMGAGDHEIIMLTSSVPCVRGLMCSQAHLRHGRAHAHLVVL